jgi:hypothetical protein
MTTRRQKNDRLTGAGSERHAARDPTKYLLRSCDMLRGESEGQTGQECSDAEMVVAACPLAPGLGALLWGL